MSPSDLSRTLRRYCEPDAGRAILEVAVTAIPLVLLWTAQNLLLVLRIGKTDRRMASANVRRSLSRCTSLM